MLVLLFGSTARADGAEMPLQQAASGNLYVAADLGPVHTDMLLDTGSGYVSLTRRTFRELRRTAPSDRQPAYVRRITGVTADGRAASVEVYSLPELRLGECTLFDVEAVVMPGADRDILGLNALSRLEPLTLDLRGRRMTGGACLSQRPSRS